jgi:putative CocE/NonD family hydrolase
MHAGAFDQSAVAQRPDVLVFATPPLEEDLEVTGPVTLRLWIASDAPDTDFTAKLIDVYPPTVDYPHGFAMNLTEGLLRVRYRDSWERPALMTPGEVYAITIELFPVANLFGRGHRLRLDISSSNFPHFDVNPNSESRRARGSSRASPTTESLSRQAALHTSYCRSSRGTKNAVCE